MNRLVEMMHRKRLRRLVAVRVLIAVVGGLSVDLRAADEAAANPAADTPYSPIVERNVFGLLPPVPPPDPNAVEPPDLPKITVSGIMNVFGDVKVLFTTPGVGKEAKEIYYDLAAGEAENDIEVVSIDEKGGKVKFKNHGTVQDLALAKEPKDGDGGGGGGGNVGGGRPAAFPGGIPHPMMPPGGGGYNGAQAIGGGFAGRNGFNNNNGNSGGYNGSGDNANTGLTFGNANHVVSTPPNLPQYPSTADTQIIAIEAQRLATQQQVDEGTMPPFPPTPLTPEGATGSGGVPLVH